MVDVIVHLTEVTPTSTIASAGITRFVMDTLKPGAPFLVDTKDKAGMILQRCKKVGILYLVNGPPAFCNFREELAELVRRCQTMVWIHNDYTIYPPSQVNKVCRERGWVRESGQIEPPTRWTTIPDTMHSPNDVYVNWNVLTYDPRKVMYDSKINRLFYFGAYRIYRRGQFRRYLKGNEQKLVISASGRAAPKFGEMFPGADVRGPSDDVIAEAAKYRYGLYIHDDSSVNRYMSLANRFYEMLSARNFILVAENAVRTFERAGYKVNPQWIVTDASDVAKKLRTPRWLFRKHVTAQRQRWGWRARKEREDLTKLVIEVDRGVR